MKTPVLAVLAALLAFSLWGCSRSGPSSPSAPSEGASGADLMLLSGSENKSLEPIFKRFAEKNNIGLHVDYLGSVDIMLQLENGAPNYDAIWPANSLWVDLGDKQKRVRHQTSISQSLSGRNLDAQPHAKPVFFTPDAADFGPGVACDHVVRP